MIETLSSFVGADRKPQFRRAPVEKLRAFIPKITGESGTA
jgi:hypothetical protein